MTDLAYLGFAIETQAPNKAADGLDKLTGAAGRTEKATDRMNRTLERSEKAAARMRLGILAVAGATTAAIAGLIAVGRSAINGADNFAKMSQRVGVSVEVLSSLSHAAALSDVSLENLSTGMGFLNRAMNEFARGSENDATKALRQLGVSVVDTSGVLRSNIEVLGDVADRLASMGDGAQKSALAMEIFGRGGAAMIPMLNAGREGLERMAAEADRLGITISTETARAAEEFNDNLTRLGAAMQGLVNRITAAVLPALVSFSEWLAKLDPLVVAAGGALLTATGIVAGFGAAAKVTAVGVSALTASLGGLAAVLGTIASIPGAMAFLAGGIFLGSTTPAGGQSEREFERWVNGRLDAVNALREALSGRVSTPSAADLYGGFLFGDDGKMILATNAVRTLADELGGDR